jgi:hypothetical protein
MLFLALSRSSIRNCIPDEFFLLCVMALAVLRTMPVGQPFGDSCDA